MSFKKISRDLLNTVDFIEIYFKGESENEDKERVKRYLTESNLLRRKHPLSQPPNNHWIEGEEVEHDLPQLTPVGSSIDRISEISRRNNDTTNTNIFSTAV